MSQHRFTRHSLTRMERLTFTAEVLPDPLATVRAALAAMTDDELGPCTLPQRRTNTNQRRGSETGANCYTTTRSGSRPFWTWSRRRIRFAQRPPAQARVNSRAAHHHKRMCCCWGWRRKVDATSSDAAPSRKHGPRRRRRCACRFADPSGHPGVPAFLAASGLCFRAR